MTHIRLYVVFICLLQAYTLAYGASSNINDLPNDIDDETKDLFSMTIEFDKLIKAGKIPEVSPNISVIEGSKSVKISISKFNNKYMLSKEYKEGNFNNEIKTCDNLYIADIQKSSTNYTNNDILRTFMCKRDGFTQLLSVYKYDSITIKWIKMPQTN